jgi:hypothetical protein
MQCTDPFLAAFELEYSWTANLDAQVVGSIGKLKAC